MGPRNTPYKMTLEIIIGISINGKSFTWSANGFWTQNRWIEYHKFWQSNMASVWNSSERCCSLGLWTASALTGGKSAGLIPGPHDYRVQNWPSIGHWAICARSIFCTRTRIKLNKWVQHTHTAHLFKRFIQGTILNTYKISNKTLLRKILWWVWQSRDVDMTSLPLN